MNAMRADGVEDIVFACFGKAVVAADQPELSRAPG
jgi:hypothetical protein